MHTTLSVLRHPQAKLYRLPPPLNEGCRQWQPAASALDAHCRCCSLIAQRALHTQASLLPLRRRLPAGLL
jgi:hypothetical protein